MFGKQAIGGAFQMAQFNLPDLILLEDYNGDFQEYIKDVYQLFKEDFVDSKPKYRGKRLGLKKYPLVDGREYTFYHFTHKGDIENERIPDFRRMERIVWPRPMIDNSENQSLIVWRNVRRGRGGTRNRILIFHEQEKYLVVLDDRGDYILPWTAYLVRNTKANKLIKEYEEYKKAETAK